MFINFNAVIVSYVFPYVKIYEIVHFMSTIDVDTLIELLEKKILEKCKLNNIHRNI